MNNAPTLIMGMHRSGTTLLSECLEQLGWYGGWLKNASNESTFYVRINDWILQNCGVDWETAANIEEGIEFNYDLMSVAVNSARRYIGWLEYGKKVGCLKKKQEWGFKDPRTSFTLPFWSRFYPDLKVIHIRRHGLDVSRSLIKRKLQHRTMREGGTIFKDIWDIYKGNKLYTTTVTSDINESMALWFKYEQQCRAQIQRHSSISVSFESFLENPSQVLKSIVDFLGLEATEEDCHRIAQKIDKSRALAYRVEGDIDIVSEASKLKLREFGYEL